VKIALGYPDCPGGTVHCEQLLLLLPNLYWPPGPLVAGRRRGGGARGVAGVTARGRGPAAVTDGRRSHGAVTHAGTARAGARRRTRLSTVLVD